MARQVPTVPAVEEPEPEAVVPEPVRYIVTGAIAVIRHGKQERYVNRGVVFSSDDIDADNAEHLLNIAGLIEVYEEPAEEPADDDTE